MFSSCGQLHDTLRRPTSMLNKPTNYAELIKIPAKLMILILKVISVTPTQHTSTRSESITFYTHTHTQTHTHTLTSDREIDTAVKERVYK